MEFKPPRGTDDLLPPMSTRMLDLYQRARDWAQRFAFEYIETPAFEFTSLFTRTSGESSDLVTKEMYSFHDRRQRSLTLRPEGTAPVVRAALSRRVSSGERVLHKFFYVEPMWRYGRPQAGRLREFRQFGVEVIGSRSANADAEVIELGWRFLKASGVRGLRLELNSLGDFECRPRYRQALLSFLESRQLDLVDEHRTSFRDNPMRVLDCKDEACRRVALQAPDFKDFLCDNCKRNFMEVTDALSDAKIPWERVATLVRGLDYYERTAFEYVSDVLPRSQNSVGGGGRYDGLAELLGLPPAPGVGFALGLERVLMSQANWRQESVTRRHNGVYVVALGGTARSWALDFARVARGKRMRVQLPYEGDPIPTQLKAAGKSGFGHAVIVTEEDLTEGVVKIRNLSTGHTRRVLRADLEADPRIASRTSV